MLFFTLATILINPFDLIASPETPPNFPKETPNQPATDRFTNPKLPTKIYPLFIKVGCLTRDYCVRGAKSLDDLQASDDDGDCTDYLMLTMGKSWKYDFLSGSPGEFVDRLQEAVSKERNRLLSADENRGKYNVRCVIKLLVLEGHIGGGIGGSPPNSEPYAKDGAKIGGLTAKQIGKLHKLMADEATIYWVACMSMNKNGTAQALQKVLGSNGGVFVGLKNSCWADESFPNESPFDDSYPVAVRIPRGAEPKDLERLFNLCGLPVKGDTEYFFDRRFPGKTLRPWCFWCWFPEEFRIPFLLGPVIELPAVKK